MTRNIDIMLSRPGLYVIYAVEATLCFVEVDAEGRCFQLELKSGKYERDGELRPGLWIIDSILALHGPFSRLPA